MAENLNVGYSVGILVVSDTVSRGEKVDISGINIENVLKSENLFPTSSIIRHCVPDDMNEIQSVLKMWADENSIDFILTVGGTGFSPRDVTPEATKSVIHKEAPHLASHMVLSCREKSKFSVLSRSVCGVRNHSLILNLPGSNKGSKECLEAVAELIPHILDQLKGEVVKVMTDHLNIQGLTPDRNVHKV